LGIKVRQRATIIDLTFLGTRGELAIRSRRHRRHSSLLIQHNDARIMIDCGADWLGRLSSVAPTAIVLTHAHPDHAWGLAEGAPCPVYASKETLDLLRGFPIRDRREMPRQKSVVIDGVRFKAYSVQHSIRAPAVGYRVSVKGVRFFYVPDVAGLPDAPNTLRGISVYIGDGATMTRSMVRKKNGTLIGHAPMTGQLSWCKMAGVRRAIFTHCGSPIVRGNARVLNAAIRRLGRAQGIDARLACDGNRLSLSGGGPRGRRHRARKRA
jgi:phosphoribosyl 1,2-cyclic phosphodiesterase